MSDPLFRQKCVSQFSVRHGMTPAEWYDLDVQRPEYWVPSGTGDAPPTDWSSHDSPPLVFTLPADVHAYNLDGIQSSAKMPILCLSHDQLRFRSTLAFAAAG